VLACIILLMRTTDLYTAVENVLVYIKSSVNVKKIRYFIVAKVRYLLLPVTSC